MIPIGTTLTLKPSTRTKQDTNYRARVVHVDKEAIYIDYPIDEITSKTIFLPLGANLRVTYLDHNQKVYEFGTVVMGKATYTVPTLKLITPEAVTDIQRREYVRIETAVDVAVQTVKKKDHSFTAITSDISGGGLAVQMTNHSLKIGDTTALCIVLPFSSGDVSYIYADAQVVRTRELNNATSVSMTFTTIHNQDRQVIIRYCFEKQREARRKELS